MCTHIDSPSIRQPSRKEYNKPRFGARNISGLRTLNALISRRVDRKSITNWIIGGCAMAAVAGELSYGWKTRPVCGLVELIR